MIWKHLQQHRSTTNWCGTDVFLCVLSPLLVHEQLSVEVLMVSGVLDRVDQFLGFDELVTVPLQIVRFRHDTSPW